MSKSTCSVDGCERLVEARGWCSGHYARWRSTGDVDAARPFQIRRAKPDSCDVDGCERAVKARLLCSMHLRRLYKTGDVGGAAPIPHKDRQYSKPVRVCAVDGCDKRVDARGWCQGHYRRWKKSGDVDAARPLQVRRANRGCLVDGCSNPHHAKGYCGMHASRMRKHGVTELPDRVKKPPQKCWLDGCNRAYQAKGLCGTHYARWRLGYNPRPKAGRPCKVRTCRQPVYADNYCNMHWQRLYKRGSLKRSRFTGVAVGDERLCESCWTWKTQDDWVAGFRGRICTPCNSWRAIVNGRFRNGEPTGHNHDQLKVRPTYVYRHWSRSGELLYVGITAIDEFDKRHRQHSYSRSSFWYPHDVAEVTRVLYDCRADAQEAEALAIANEHPLHNVAQPLPYLVA